MPELKTIEERRADGRARRIDAPRSSHAGWQPPADRPDPVALLEERHRRRVPELVPIRVGRMLVSPFTFLRGAAEVMAHDLASTTTSGLRVQACGDAHLLNFGVFATPERHLVFDVNDFDETLPAPWEWDVKRLAASVAVAGRGASFAPEQVDAAVAGMVRGYRMRMQELAAMAPLDVWYDRVDVDAVLAVANRQDMPSLPNGGHLLERARHHTSLAALPKLTELVDGERRIIEDPPLILHTQHGFDVPRDAFAAYRASLARDRRPLLDRYRVVDAARKVVGVGSVGHPLPHRAADGRRRRRAAVPPDQGSGGLGARPVRGGVAVRTRRGAGRDRAATHAGGQRRLPRVGRRSVRQPLLRAAAARHEGIGLDRPAHSGRAHPLRDAVWRDAGPGTRAIG